MCWPFSELSIEDPDDFVIPVARHRHRSSSRKHSSKRQCRCKKKHKGQCKNNSEAWYTKILMLFKSKVSALPLLLPVLDVTGRCGQVTRSRVQKISCAFPHSFLNTKHKNFLSPLHIKHQINVTKMWHDKTKQPFENDAQVFTYIPRYDGNAPVAPSHLATGVSAYGGAQPLSYAQPLPCQYPSHSVLPPYHHQLQPHYYTDGSRYYYSGGNYSHITQPKYIAPAQPAYTYHPQSYYHDSYGQYHYPAMTQPKYSTKPLKDGSLPWYGRTEQEVAEDAYYEAEYEARELRRAAKKKIKEKKAKKEEAKKEKDKDDEKDSEKSSGGGSPKAKTITYEYEYETGKDGKVRVKKMKEIEREKTCKEPKGKPSDQYWVVHTDGAMRAYPLGTIRHNFEGDWKIDSNGWPFLQET